MIKALKGFLGKKSTNVKPVESVDDVVSDLSKTMDRLHAVHTHHVKEADVKTEMAKQLNEEATEHKTQSERALKVHANIKNLLAL